MAAVMGCIGSSISGLPANIPRPVMSNGSLRKSLSLPPASATI